MDSVRFCPELTDTQNIASKAQWVGGFPYSPCHISVASVRVSREACCVLVGHPPRGFLWEAQAKTQRNLDQQLLETRLQLNEARRLFFFFPRAWPPGSSIFVKASDPQNGASLWLELLKAKKKGCPPTNEEPPAFFLWKLQQWPPFQGA